MGLCAGDAVVRKKPLTFGSLFSGCGGMDIGFENAGFAVRWQCETNEDCRELLTRYWKRKGVMLYGDIRKLVAWDRIERVDLIAGGDPCPKHSRARSNGESNHPDLSGYFLAMVGRLRPRWVVRENVPAPTVSHFSAALGALGYGAVVIRIDGAKITGQSRQRDFTVGLDQGSAVRVREIFQDCADGPGPYTTRLGTGQIAPGLTCHRTRYDSRDCYIWEPGVGLRILDAFEREALAGLPVGWTVGFSEATRARMCGNCVIPEAAEWIGQRILNAEQDQQSTNPAALSESLTTQGQA